MTRAFVPFYPPSHLLAPKTRLINIGPLYILIGFSVMFLRVVLTFLCIFLCISDRTSGDRPKKLFTVASFGEPMSSPIEAWANYLWALPLKKIAPPQSSH